MINTLTATVPNPFAGLINSGTLSGSTTTVAQLLSRFPQYPTGTGSQSTGVLIDNQSIGSSYFESLNVRLQKRFSGGLTLIGNYIHSKLIERDTWLNDTDAAPEKRISAFDHPNRFVSAITYELPFGRNGRFHFGSRLMNAVAGGWIVNGIYTYQAGQPLVWANGSTASPGDYIYSGGPLHLNNRETNTVAFDTTQFNTVSTQLLQYHIRTFSTTFANLRQDGINQFDASVIKRFQVTERARFDLRFEGFNVLNHPTFAAPNVTATSSAFGSITAQANRPRAIQVGAHFAF